MNAILALAIGLTAVGLAVGVHFWLRCRRLAASAAGLSGHLDRHEAALAAAPAAYIAWSRADESEQHSAGLADLLGLEASGPLTWRVVRARFAEADAAMLEDAVTALLRQGTRFAFTAATSDGERKISVTGARTGEGRQAVDVLWLVDVTAATARTRHLTIDAEALEGERARLHILIDALPIPVWQRARDLSLAYCNRAYAAAVDAENPAAAVLGEREIAASVIEADGQALAERARRTGAPVSESHHVVIGGARRLLEFTETTLDQSGFLGGWAQDFTALESVQAELSRHIEAHAEVLEQLHSGIAMFDQERRLTFFNQGYAQLWKIDPEWLHSGPDIGEVLEVLRERRRLPEVADFRAYKQSRLALFHSVLEPVEGYLYLPDDTTVREIVAPHPLGGLVFMYEDVTDRLALERSYNTLTAVQRETLNELREGVAVYGTDGRIKLCNPAFLRNWRLPESIIESEPHIDELVERNRSLYHADRPWAEYKAGIVGRVMQRTSATGRILRTDGRVLDFTAVPLPDGSVLYSETDVTDTYNVERALLERNEALQEADRLKTEFLANMSYELRTPLNTIIGFTEILANDYFGELNRRQSEYCHGILDASQRLLGLINDILDLAMVEAGQIALEPSRIEVGTMLSSVLNLARERARKQNLRIGFDCPPEVGTIIADERRLKQVVFNLVSNAVNFTPSGGAVTVAARRLDGTLSLQVSDTGAGMIKDDIDRVFGAFERGRPAGEARRVGAGLGLTLVKKFIELHGGTVELSSEIGTGTTVTCLIPVDGSGIGQPPLTNAAAGGG